MQTPIIAPTAVKLSCTIVSQRRRKVMTYADFQVANEAISTKARFDNTFRHSTLLVGMVAFDSTAPLGGGIPACVTFCHGRVGNGRNREGWSGNSAAEKPYG